ncbi:MAG: acylphosphatase [Mariprofundaceae bacterium]|nr:acylphosphatase [Mariprofundaceae bacterium]
MNTQTLCYEVTITGTVQGVGFRYATLQQARTLKLTGWVRNCDDGSVEVLICGEASAIQPMLGWLADGGPATATVEQMSFALSQQTSVEAFTIR